MTTTHPILILDNAAIDMITYRTYSESLTGYTEFDEKWSFTRLSYFAFLTGVSYEIGGKSKKM